MPAGAINVDFIFLYALKGYFWYIIILMKFSKMIELTGNYIGEINYDFRRGPEKT